MRGASTAASLFHAVALACHTLRSDAGRYAPSRGPRMHQHRANASTWPILPAGREGGSLSNGLDQACSSVLSGMIRCMRLPGLTRRSSSLTLSLLQLPPMCTQSKGPPIWAELSSEKRLPLMKEADRAGRPRDCLISWSLPAANSMALCSTYSSSIASKQGSYT